MAAAGSIIVTTAQINGGLTKYSIAWTADASGAVNGNSFQMQGGHILQVKFVPGNGGTAPSADYVVTLLDADGVDLLAGKGNSSLSASAASIAVPEISSASPAYNDPSIGSPPGSVTPTITGAGNGGQGRVDILVGP